MSNILVVTGSVRPNSANEKVVPYVVEQLKDKGAEVTIADLKELNLPFFNSPYPPTSPDFAPADENVKRWTQMIVDADGIVFVTPEYNHTLSPVQMNAIDWVGKEWEGKKVSLVGYGWTSGADRAHETAREALAVNLKAEVLSTQANLFFMKDLNPDGSVADAESTARKVGAALDELLLKVNEGE